MLFNGILETTTTTGTGNLTTSAVTGRPRFTDVFTANATEASADLFYYSITTQDNPPQLLESGIGYMSATGTLVRAVPILTYSAGAFAHYPATAADLAAGTKNIACSGEAASWDAGLHAVASIGGSQKRCIGPTHLQGSTNSTSNSVKDRLVYVPVKVNTPRKINSIMMSSGGTAGASGTRGLHVGLYSCLKDGKPGRKLYESGDLSVAINSVITYTLASPVRLPPGWYYAAFVHDFATAPSFYSSSAGTGIGGCAESPLGWETNAGIARTPACYEALTAGWSSMPAAAAGTLTPVYATSGTGQVPYVVLGVD